MSEMHREKIVAPKGEKCMISIRRPNGEMSYFECDSFVVAMATDKGFRPDGTHDSDSNLEYCFSSTRHAAHLFEIVFDFLYKTSPNLLKFQLVDFLKRNGLLVDRGNGQYEFRITTTRDEIEKEINKT